MFRVGIINIKGDVTAKNFKTREEVDDYILRKDEETKVKYARIINLDTGKVEVINF